MMRFFAQAFARMISELERAESALVLSMSNGDPEWLQVAVTQVRAALSTTETTCSILPLNRVVQDQVKRLAIQVMEDTMTDTGSRRVILRLIQELKINVVGDLRQHLFLLIPAEDKQLYLKPIETYWTEQVADAFPEAKYDMDCAAKCYALEQWNASVFHCMNVAQHGLRRLADRFGVVFSKDFDGMNWGQIISEIDAHLRKLGQSAKTPEVLADIKVGSEASSHFFGMKEAWRNYVMHGRGSYDGPQARAIGETVRAIMRAMI